MPGKEESHCWVPKETTPARYQALPTLAMIGPPLSPVQESVAPVPWAHSCDWSISRVVTGPSLPSLPAAPYTAWHSLMATESRKVYCSREELLSLSVLPHPATTSPVSGF